jgi:hypothetical protein
MSTHNSHVIATASQQTGLPGRYGRIEVFAQRHELLLRDGAIFHLHTVLASGVTARLLRAIVDGPTMVLIDLEKLSPGIDAELARATQLDRVGHVFYALRQAYPTGQSLRQQLHQHALHVWPTPDGGAAPIPSLRTPRTPRTPVAAAAAAA